MGWSVTHTVEDFRKFKNWLEKTFSQKIRLISVLQFQLYAEGLEALIGGDDESETTSDGPEATAGMTLSLMDVLLRPIEFFRGSGGLMSAVWNAPSEPVSALQV